MIVDKINAYLSTTGKTLDGSLIEEVGNLAKMSFVKQFGFKEERLNKNPYFSSIGKCLRQQAYDLNGFKPEGKELDSRARMVFWMGDMAEIAIMQVAKAAGCVIEQAGTGQARYEFDGMSGRPDGIAVLPDGERVLLESKSMASYTFERFETGDIETAYLYQCNAGMKSEGVKRACIIAMNKDAGVLAEKVIDLDPKVVDDIHKRLATLRASTKDNLPERPYKPDAKGFYPWQCRYCAHFRTCLPNSELVLVRNSYKLKEK